MAPAHNPDFSNPSAESESRISAPQKLHGNHPPEGEGWITGKVVRGGTLGKGNHIERGEALSFYWPEPRNRPSEVCAVYKGESIIGGAVVALKMLGMAPTEDKLIAALCDGECDTPNGHTVEPDGVDPQGVPSWLKIYGLI
ncbi:MAG TPA: hypothetical protein VK465_00100 [Fibrobacteria bacterium]|nr:hypothetical protein [Fibrobacteria bacterium]